MEYKFVLTHKNTSVTITDSPDNNEAVDNFGEFQSEINRDFSTHGMVYQFSSGDLKLGFYGDGKSLLESAFQQDGLNATVTLVISSRTLATDDGAGKAFKYMLPRFENTTDDSAAFGVSVSGSSNLSSSTEFGSGDHFWIAQRAGDLTFSAVIKEQVEGEWARTGLPSPTVNTVFTYTWVLKHLNEDGTLVTKYDRDSSGLSSWGRTDTVAGDGATKDFGIVTDTLAEQAITMTKGQRLVFYFQYEIDPQPGINGDYTFNLDLYHNSNLTISNTTDVVTTTVKHYFLFDVLERITYIITGVQFAFWSDFFALTDHGAGADGCGGLASISNGAQLRGINTDIEISLKDVLESLQAIFAIGWSVEDTYPEAGDGADFRLRVELLEFYYSDTEVLNLGNVTNFSASTFTPLTFNQIEIGYKTFSKEENLQDSIEDFATLSEYSTPVNKTEGDYKQISSLIASPELIQETFLQDDTTKQWKYDNKNFIFLLVRSGGNFIPENNENFSSTAGVSFPAQTYNLRIAPVYMLINHSLIINSSLLGQAIVDNSIVNNTSNVNKSFVVQMDPTFSCKLKDSGISRSATGDILISNMFLGLRLFEPTKHTFTVELTTTQFNTIVASMTNNLYNNSKNFGFLTYNDEEPTANVQTGWPLNIKWNTVSEIATIECVERSDIYLV